jgi:hypothetical protein
MTLWRHRPRPHAVPPGVLVLGLGVARHLPGPETAVFGGYAPCEPTQKRHTKAIYIGETRRARNRPPGGPGPRSCSRACTWRRRAPGPLAGVISDCHFAVQLGHFIPVVLRYHIRGSCFSKVTIGYYPITWPLRMLAEFICGHLCTS